MSKPVKTHEITTWSGQSWPLTEQEANYMRERMEAGAKFVTVPDGTPLGATVSLNDIKGIKKRQISMADLMTEQKALPQGERKFNPLGPGYIKFLAGSLRLAMKHGRGTAAIEAKISDEQKPLVNKELEKSGLDYRV